MYGVATVTVSSARCMYGVATVTVSSARCMYGVATVTVQQYIACAQWKTAKLYIWCVGSDCPTVPAVCMVCPQ